MIKPIMRDPAFLAQKSQPATINDAAVITDLLDTLRANADRCVGMAANMIGIQKNMIVCQMGPLAAPLVNPVIIKRSWPYQTKEGCLSLTGQRSTTRYQTITVNFENQNFQPQQQTFSGWIAQIIQHEIDHCNGILI